MKNSYFSNIITFLLFTLMLFKVSSFHAYTHHDADEDNIERCEICELAIENQDNEFVIVNTTSFTKPIFILNNYEPTVLYNLVLSSSFLHTSFFGRPPPQVS